MILPYMYHSEYREVLSVMARHLSNLFEKYKYTNLGDFNCTEVFWEELDTEEIKDSWGKAISVAVQKQPFPRRKAKKITRECFRLLMNIKVSFTIMRLRLLIISMIRSRLQNATSSGLPLKKTHTQVAMSAKSDKKNYTELKRIIMQ